MSTRLVILGLLQSQPLHGYEIKHIIEDHMGDWASIAFGSIYFAIGKLAEEGFIEKAATEKEGGRPSRTVYRITEEGRAEFMRLLRQTWSELEIRRFDLDVGLFFMDALPIGEVKMYLQGRVAQLEGIVGHVVSHREEQLADENVPPQAAAIFDHSLAHMVAELEWTRDLLDKIERGEYP